jgi:hypothetical protein
MSWLKIIHIQKYGHHQMFYCDPKSRVCHIFWVHVTHTEEKSNQHRIWWVNQKESDLLGDLALDGRLKRDSYEIEWDAMDWIRLAEDRDKWRAVVNKVTNFRVP